MIKFTHTYQNIISLDNLLVAWKEFRNGKRSRKDVQVFENDLMRNIFQLHEDLVSKNYRHSKYITFKISDPKPRVIHKAKVKDRLFHHVLHRALYPFFDKKFINDSYSCRVAKGPHAALERFHEFFFKVSKNDTRTAWVLSEVINSFELSTSKGLPLGNLTSQLFANIYMDRFDKFVKHVLNIKFYIRYADDFVFMSHDKNSLLELLPKIRTFLLEQLCLELHEHKILIRTLVSGIDFLGWVHFFDHRVLRTATKRRMFRNIKLRCGNKETIQSYLGTISHGNTYKLQQEISKLVSRAI